MTKPRLVIDVLHLPDLTDNTTPERQLLNKILLKIRDAVEESGSRASAVTVLTECTDDELNMMLAFQLHALLAGKERKRENYMELAADCVGDILLAMKVHASVEEITHDV